MSNTRSGRQVKKVGQSESKQSALSSLAKLRKGEGKRTDQYEVDEGKQIFEEMDNEDYAKLEDERRANNFIVGDDEDGYRDYGGEIWEHDDECDEEQQEKKATRGNKPIQNFFFNNQGDSKSKKNPANSAAAANKSSITKEESSAIMSNLLKKLDDKTEDVGVEYVSKENEFTGFNIYDQNDQKYDFAPPILPKSTNEVEINNEQEDVQNESSLSPKIKNDFKEIETDIVANQHTNNLTPKVFDGDVEMEDVSENMNTEPLNLSTDDKKRPLPLNSDNTLSVFWIDGHEEVINQSEVYLFGKIYDSSVKKYSSI